MDYLEAYKQLREFEPDLAQVSLSLIPGEGNVYAGRPSLSSDLLVQRVETVPERQMKDRYAQKFLEYKDIVEVEYSANYIESLSSIKVIKDPSGLYFVHYAVEPERLSVVAGADGQARRSNGSSATATRADAHGRHSGAGGPVP